MAPIVSVNGAFTVSSRDGSPAGPWGATYSVMPVRQRPAGGQANGLDRRTRRIVEEAVAGGAVGQPDRQAAWRGDPQRRDRQGAQAGPLRPRRAVAAEPARLQGAAAAAPDLA